MKPISLQHPTVAPQLFSLWPAPAPPVRIPLAQLGAHPCPYLPGQSASDRAFLTDAMPPRLYHQLMDRGFRRSGKVVYQPVCRSCRACTPVRVRVDDFVPGKSHRRCHKRNSDLTVEEGPLVPDRERFELYCRYQRTRHGEADHLDWQSFIDFLYDSPVQTREFSYRDAAGKLVAVGIADVSNDSLSSVYFYYDPDQPRRGLGTFGVLREIEQCRRVGIPHYYLGFWVQGCERMQYKINFRPCQTLGTDGVWRDLLEPFEAES